MVNTVAPVWDGNETWLVFGGAALLAAFPVAYAVILSALYIPLVLMLGGLIWRGVAFEFRFKADDAHKPFWDKAFAWGSYIATISQGIALGAFINGFKVTEGAFAGGSFDWLTPFSLFTGLALVVAYVLLGATWLIMKTEGALQARAYRLALGLGIATIVAIGAVEAITRPERRYWRRWFAFPQVIFTVVVPVLVAIATLVFFTSLKRRRNYTPFLMALSIFTLSLAGLGISLFPYVVPPSITIWDAAAPTASLKFMLPGAVLVMVPIILAYTGYSYWVFRGKTGHEGYH